MVSRLNRPDWASSARAEPSRVNFVCDLRLLSASEGYHMERPWQVLGLPKERKLSYLATNPKAVWPAPQNQRKFEQFNPNARNAIWQEIRPFRTAPQACILRYRQRNTYPGQTF